MSIRSIGKFLACLRHSRLLTRGRPVSVAASRSTWVLSPSRFFSSQLAHSDKYPPVISERTRDPTASSSSDLSVPSDPTGNSTHQSRTTPNFPPTRPDVSVSTRQERRKRAWRIRLGKDHVESAVYMVGSDPTVKEQQRDRFRTPTGPAFRVEHSQNKEQENSAFTVFLDHSLSRRFVPRLRRVDSVPGRHRITARPPHPLQQRDQRVYWDQKFGELAFPEDGDLLEAQQRAIVFQLEATSLLRLSQNLSSDVTRIPPRYLTKYLVPLVIGALAHSAKSALDLMLVLQPLTTFRLHMQCDCILYISKVYKTTLEKEPAIREMLDRQIEGAAVVGKWPNKMPRNVLVAMLNHSRPHTRQNIIDSVFARYNPVPLPLRLSMIDHYTYHNKPKDALDILSRLSPEELKSATPSLLGRFYNLLKIDTVESSSTGLNFQILPSLVATGIPLNDSLHNVVLERAVTLGLPDVAWEVYRFMESNNISVDARRHLVLLRSCFQRGDLEGLNRIMSSIHQSPNLVKDRFLVSYTMNIVRYVCYFERKLPMSESLAHILAVYDRVYDRAPLVKLAIVDSLPPSETRVALKLPDGLQLGFTLWTYVLVQRSDHHVSHLWLQFIHLVNMGDPDMCAVAAHDVLYNGLITYWGRNPETLINAVETLEEMERLNLCEPTELTWVLLVSAFTRHGQQTAAENIRHMMKVRGVNPNMSRWQFLLDHYPESELAARIEADFDAKGIHAGQATTKPPSRLGTSG